MMFADTKMFSVAFKLIKHTLFPANHVLHAFEKLKSRESPL